MIFGGRLDISCDTLPRLRGVLRHSGVVTLQKVLEMAGPTLNEVKILSSVLATELYPLDPELPRVL